MSQPQGRSVYLHLDAEDGLKSPAFMSPGLKSAGLKTPGIKSPGFMSPRQGLFLSKPLMGNGSSTSLNEMGQPHTPSGIRAQLGHLLPRHAYFRARVTIHQISSVPFVSGEFGVRWKFKGHSGSKQGLLGRVKARAETKRTISNEQRVGADRVQEVLFSPGAPGEDGHVTVTSPGGSRADASGSSGGGDSSSVVSPPQASRANTLSSLSSSISSRTSDPISESNHHTAPTEWGTLSTSSTAAASHSSVATTIPSPSAMTSSFSGTATPDPTLPSSTLARGMTAFLPLKEHSVVWSQTLDTILKFDIDRETSQILPNPLKLVVMQRVIAGDPHGPQNPRLGAVYLNLAEYVGQGSVSRRYLLKESKTNAILKVCITFDFLFCIRGVDKTLMIS